MKKKKKIIRTFLESENYHQIMIILYLIIFSFSIFNFMNGFHSLDLGHNAQKIELMFNTELYDLATDMKYYNTSQMYVMGVSKIIQSFFIGILSSFILGGYYFKYVIKGKTKNENK